jgi:hypothetical protein
VAQNDVNEIRIEPVNVTWEIEQQDCVQTVADVADSLDGKYFLLGSDYYVWLDGPVAADPAPAGRTGIAAAYTTNDTAAAVATAIASAVDLDANFNASASGDLVTITRVGTAAQDAAVDVDTGFSFLETQESGSLDLGFLSGNVESSFEEQLLDITAHQTGTTVLSALRQGVSASITLTMQQATVAKLKDLFARTGGGAHTPAGGGATELYGWGTSRQGDNAIPQSRRLILKPVNAVDESRTLCFWKAYPLPSSLVLSGEEAKTLEVEWRLFLDDSKPSEISYFAFGDYTQLIPA